jgi:hypothetical protein
LITYRATDFGDLPGTGIRCLVFTGARSPGHRIPAAMWYGEGRWFDPARPYRHIAVGFLERGSQALTSYAGEIAVPGEQTQEGITANLNLISLSGNWRSPKRIDLIGDWGEHFTRAPSVQMQPVPLLDRCGTELAGYAVTYPGRTGSGTSCVLRVGKTIMAWFAHGVIAGKSYSEVGFLGPAGYGARDLCDRAFGTRCETFSSGAIKLSELTRSTGEDGTHKLHQITVTRHGMGGTWSEQWRQQGS